MLLHTSANSSASFRGDGAAVGAASLCATTIAVLLLIGGVEPNLGQEVISICILCSGCDNNLKSGKQCELCGLWYHMSCGKNGDRDNDKWFCSKCKENRLRQLEEKLEADLLQIQELRVLNAALEYKLRAATIRDTAQPIVEAPIARKPILVIGDSIVRHVGKDNKHLDVMCLPGVRTEQLRR